jgi:hypothetical protein
MNNFGKYIPWGILIAVGVTAVLIGVYGQPDWNQLFDKLNSIVVPKPPIGNLTPARDLRGTWKSSLPGKGLQLYGVIKSGPSITTVTEDGDIEIVIDDVTNGIATGKVRYTNLNVTAVTSAPKIKTITVKGGQKDSGYLPLTIRVSSSALDFGSQTVNGVKITMQGTYTTDIMTGSMMANMFPYGVIKGVFHLMRKQ